MDPSLRMVLVAGALLLALFAAVLSAVVDPASGNQRAQTVQSASGERSSRL